MLRSNQCFSLWLPCAALLAASPALAAKPAVVATVNGVPVPLSDYRRALSGELEDWPEAAADPAVIERLREKALDGLIDEELLYQESVKRGVKVSEDELDDAVDEIKYRFNTDASGAQLTGAQAEASFYAQLRKDGRTEAEFVERVRMQAAARKLVKMEVGAQLAAPEVSLLRERFSEVQTYVASGSTEPPAGFDEDSTVDFLRIVHNVRVAGSDRARVSRILIPLAPSASEAEISRARSSLENTRTQLLSGTSTFAQAGGRDIGDVIKGKGPPELEKAAFALEAGRISEPFLTPDGYNLIRVDARLAAVRPDLETLKSDLMRLQRRLDYHKALLDYLQGLRSRARIERSVTLPQ